MSWDPERYERFADHRARPAVELLSRIPDVDATSIVDLGCGTGHLTALMGGLWPRATVVGIDSSPEMLEQARAHRPGMEWRLGNVETWEPEAPVDIIFSNAALHWLDDHSNLFPRLRSFLAPGGVLAVQMPDNWDEPTHTVPAEVLDDGTWPVEAANALLRNGLSAADEYLSWVQPADVDVWRTTYYQQLTGDDPVWTWVTGSVLGPVLAALEEADQQRFEAACKVRYGECYPPGSEGVTLLPFSRVFIVARAPA